MDVIPSSPITMYRSRASYGEGLIFKNIDIRHMRKIGELEVSPIGIGCMGFSHGYGEIPSEDYSIETIRMAYDHGCTFFDTAEIYSPELAGVGHNERIVGRALEGCDAVIATKLHLDASEVRRRGLEETVRSHLAGSMERLRIDHVPLYYLHRVNTDIPLVDVAEVMGRVADEGLIDGWGLSQVSLEQLRAAHSIHPVTAVQSIYSMVERDLEREIIPFCMENGIGVVPFSPIASGLLSGKVTASTDFSHSDDVRKFVPQLKPGNIEANQPIVDLLRRWAGRKDATPAQISLAWMLRKYPNVVPIPGSKNKERTIENLDAWNIVFTDEEFSELESELDRIPVHGHRGSVQVEGSKMSDRGKD